MIYYYLAKIARAGNSQDYPVKQERQARRPRALTHRDFIGLGSLILAIANLTRSRTGVPLFPEHLRLRKESRVRGGGAQALDDLRLRRLHAQRRYLVRRAEHDERHPRG